MGSCKFLYINVCLWVETEALEENGLMSLTGIILSMTAGYYRAASRVPGTNLLAPFQWN